MMNQSIISNNPCEQSFDLFALENPIVTNTQSNKKKTSGWLRKTKAKNARDLDAVRQSADQALVKKKDFSIGNDNVLDGTNTQGQEVDLDQTSTNFY